MNRLAVLTTVIGFILGAATGALLYTHGPSQTIGIWSELNDPDGGAIISLAVRDEPLNPFRNQDTHAHIPDPSSENTNLDWIYSTRAAHQAALTITEDAVEYPLTGAPDFTGTSAGLALTLVSVDAAHPGSINGTLRVAATGTVNGAVVHPVNGIPAKAAAAQAADVDVIITHPANIEEFEQHTTGIEIIGVYTVADAVTWLCHRTHSWDAACI